MSAGKVLFLSHVNSGTPNDIGNGFMREFMRNGALFLDYRDLYLERGYSGSQRFLREFLAANGIEVLVFASDSTSFDLPPEFFRGLRPGIFTVMMAGDTAYYFDVRDKHYAAAMDLLAVYDSFETVEEFNRLGGDAIIFLSSYDRARYFRSEKRERTVDVSFIGGLAGRKDRAEHIEYLRANGIAVQTFGFGAPGGQVTQERMVEIFNRSRITLNFTDTSVPTRLTRDLPVPPGRKQLKGRIAEAALCGCFVLSESAYGIERVLVPGREMDVFSSKEELLEKTRFYLSHEAEREAAAERAYQRAINDYDLSQAVRKLQAEISARLKTPRPAWAGLPPDPVFARNFSSYRMFFIINFLKRLRPLLALEELLLILRLGTLDPGQFYSFFVEEVADKFPRAKALLKRLRPKP